MARREPTMRLKSVDLPTLGRPTIATMGVVVSIANERVGELSMEGLNEICLTEPPVQNAATKTVVAFDADDPESLL
jgi:hypothetical protein